MKNYFFEVRYSDGTSKKMSDDSLATAMSKQREWVKKAMKNNNINEVTAVMPS
jgi:hypothetical protein